MCLHCILHAYIYVTIYNIHVFKFHAKCITLYISFHKVIFFSTLCFWDLSIFIYAHFHCIIVFYLFIHSLVGGYVDDFQFFPIISNVILGSFFFMIVTGLYSLFILVAGVLSSGIWWCVPSSARARISPEVNCRVEGHAHLSFIRPCQIALQSDCTNLFSHQLPGYLLYILINTW